MALGFGDIPLEVVIRASNQLAPGLAAAGAQLKAFQREVGLSGSQMTLPGMGGGGSGLLGAIGPTLAIAGGVAALAAVGTAAKSLVDTYRDVTTSTASLVQAYDSVGLSFNKSRDSIDKWLDVNAGFISNLDQAREGFATLTRSGLQQNVVMQAMNEALNLSAIKHIDLSTAVEIITKAYQGQGRGLIDLGIHMSQFDGATGVLTKHVLDQGKLTKELNTALAGGTKEYDSLSIAQNKLGREWEKISTGVGPGLVIALTQVVDGLDTFLQALEWAAGVIGNVIGVFGAGGTGGHTTGGGHAGVTGPTTHQSSSSSNRNPRQNQSGPGI